MGNAAGHGADERQALLFGHAFLFLVQSFQFFVHLLQTDVFLFNRTLALDGIPEGKDDNDQRDHKQDGKRQDPDAHILDRSGDLRIIHDGADAQEILSEIKGKIGGYLCHPGRRIVRPPVGMVDLDVGAACQLVRYQHFQL